MLVRQLWDDKLPIVKEHERKPVARIGLGGALETSTEKGRRLGRKLGWSSLWAMVTVVLFAWIRWGLIAFGVDFSNGVEGLHTTLLFLSSFLIIASHLLIFVCDALTGGDAGPSAWALVVFWTGVVVVPAIASVVLSLL